MIQIEATLCFPAELVVSAGWSHVKAFCQNMRRRFVIPIFAVQGTPPEPKLRSHDFATFQTRGDIDIDIDIRCLTWWPYGNLARIET